jgi:exosortase
MVRLFLLAMVMIPLCIWASFPSWGTMVYEWSHTDDYSHGFLVIPATLLFLYMRLDTYPGTNYKLDWVGLFPIILYSVFRIIAGLQYIEVLDAAAIWFWILGLVWFFFGFRTFLWALPSLCFLVFMFQLPFSVDVLMKNQLQLFAAQFAAAILQTVGIAAVPIKNTIRLSTTELGVEAACSGLRFLMSVFAIAFAAVLLLRRPWWQNILILAVAAPLALFVNAVRIAITGIFLERFYGMIAAMTAEGQSVSVVADGVAGKIAIFLALGLFALFVWYLGKVFRRVEI